jgi:hypothetical protein
MAEAGKGKDSRRGRKKEAPPSGAETISIDYVKSNNFRVVNVNGLIGGVTLTGDIHMAVWNQRRPYPQQVVHEITEEGTLGRELSRKARETDLLREIEVGLVFSPDMAESMIRWLQSRLEEASHLLKTSEEEDNAKPHTDAIDGSNGRDDSDDRE